MDRPDTEGGGGEKRFSKIHFGVTMLQSLFEELEASPSVVQTPDPLMALAAAFGIISGLSAWVIVRWRADARSRGHHQN